MDTILAVLLAAVVGTVFWTSVMMTFSWAGFRHGSMISVIGSDVTHKAERYFSRGLVMYYVVGLIFAPLYYLILSGFAFHNVLIDMGVSLFVGIAQGFLLMNLLVEVPADHHPQKLLERNHLAVSAGFWVGQLAYAVAVGAIISAFLTYQWTGIALSVSAFIVLSLIIGFFVRKGMHHSDKRKGPSAPVHSSGT